MGDEKRAAIYCRVSTDDQAENGYSLADQERKGRAKVADEGWSLVGEAYVDEGISGVVSDRPALNRLLTDVRTHKIDVVVITKIDRLARDMVLLLNLWKEIESYDCYIVPIDESIDTSTPQGCLNRNFVASFAEYERQLIAARTTAGRETRARSGDVWRSEKTAPYGFRYISKLNRGAYEEAVKRGDELPHENGWVQIPHEAAIVTRIFESCAQGLSMHAVAQQLNKDGVPTRLRKGPWTPPTISSILHNPAMWGKAAYGRTKVVARRGNGGNTTRTIRQTEDKIIYGNNPAIVSQNLAEAAQRMVSSHKSFSKRNSKHLYLLASSIHQPLLVCGQCAEKGKQHIMNGTARAKKETHKPYRAYRCAHNNQDGASRCHMVPAERVENAVWETVTNLAQNPDRVLAEVQALSNASSEQAVALNKAIVEIDAKAVQVANKRNDLIEYIGVWSKERVVEIDAKLAEDEKMLRKQAEDLRMQQYAAESNSLPINDVKVACSLIAQGIENATFEERQRIVRLLVKQVIAHKERYVITGTLPMLDKQGEGANNRYFDGEGMVQNSAIALTIP